MSVLHHKAKLDKKGALAGKREAEKEVKAITKQLTDEKEKFRTLG